LWVTISECHGYGYTRGFHMGLAMGTGTKLPTHQKHTHTCYGNAIVSHCDATKHGCTYILCFLTLTTTTSPCTISYYYKANYSCVLQVFVSSKVSTKYNIKVLIMTVQVLQTYKPGVSKRKGRCICHSSGRNGSCGDENNSSKPTAAVKKTMAEPTTAAEKKTAARPTTAVVAANHPLYTPYTPLPHHHFLFPHPR
jgi:hypothetical protein